MSAAARPQYSYDVFVKKIFGTVCDAMGRASNAPVAPVSGSCSSLSVKGNRSVGKKSAFMGCASREGSANR